MSFYTASLPDSIREQAEAYIRYLLSRQEGTQQVGLSPSTIDVEEFLKNWTGILNSTLDPEQTRLDYLSEKYL